MESVIDRLNNESTFTYDAVGRLTSSTDALGRTTDFDYDDRDRLVTTTLPAATINGTRKTIVRDYDKRDNLTAITNELAKTTNFDYDAHDRLVKETDPLSNETLYDYDTEKACLNN